MSPTEHGSIIGAEPAAGGGILIHCECGTTTHVRTQGPLGEYEFAVTCTGCGTSNWMSVTNRDEPVEVDETEGQIEEYPEGDGPCGSRRTLDDHA